MHYKARVSGTEDEISSAAELEARLGQLRDKASAELWLVQHKGSMKGAERFLYRLLGLATEVTADAVHVLVNREKALVVFLDGDYNEYRINNSGGPTTGSATEFRTDDGHVETAPVSECMTVEQALEAVRYFFRHGKRPDWHQYRRVK